MTTTKIEMASNLDFFIGLCNKDSIIFRTPKTNNTTKIKEGIPVINQVS